jgi:hypothetical protein
MSLNLTSGTNLYRVKASKRMQMRMLGPWVEKMEGDWRRYWLSYDSIDSAGDLAAIVGRSSLGPGWRTFSPDGESKWLREGGAKTVEDAKKQADDAIRSKYGAC